MTSTRVGRQRDAPPVARAHDLQPARITRRRMIQES